MDDIIALDEDDSVAIVTRTLLEEFHLFTGKRVTKSKSKAIPDSDKSSITSIITLYQCNRELLKLYRWKRKRNSPEKERDRKSLKEYLKFRPSVEEVELFQSFCFDFWSSFEQNISAVKEYSEMNASNIVHNFRNKNNGGHILFRPVGILPFVQACVEIHKRKQHSFTTIFERMNTVDFRLSVKPWRSVIWNPIEKTMIMGSTTVVKLLFLFIYGKNILRSSERQNLKNKYAAKLNREDEVESLLNEIPTVN